MLFAGRNKVVSIKNVHSMVLRKKLVIKRRFININGLDSWRKKFKFTNNFSNNFLNWKFNDKFLMLFLKQKLDSLSSLMYIKNDIHIKFNGNDTINQSFFIFLFYKNFYIYIPLSFNTLSNNCYSNFLYQKNNSSLNFSNSVLFFINMSLHSIVTSWFFKIIKSSFNLNFVKLRYKGKNYRWHRRKFGLVLRFGHSHLIYTKKPMSVFLKKKGRTKIIFFGTNVELIYFFLKNLIKWKPSNVYTGRGLRLSRQFLLKKAGKVSAYR